MNWGTSLGFFHAFGRILYRWNYFLDFSDFFKIKLQLFAKGEDETVVGVILGSDMANNPFSPWIVEHSRSQIAHFMLVGTKFLWVSWRK